MRAVIVDSSDREGVLRVDQMPEPELDNGQVRIAVAAAGVNRADILQRRGLYPPPHGASPVLGLECAGTVSEVDASVTSFRQGDRVMALLTGGGYAEQAAVDYRCLMATPDRLDDIRAAAVPEVFLTAFLNLFQLGGLEAGMTVLVHGGSGGVGTAAIQLAKRADARVFVTAGSEDRCRRCLELGADLAINHRSEDFVDQCRQATKGRGVDVVLDCIGSRYLARHLDLLSIDGRLVIIGLMGGSRADIDLSTLLRRRLTVIGSTLRARTAEDKGQIIGAFLHRFGRQLESGGVEPVLDRSLPLSEVAEAHRLLEAGSIFGKVVLTMS